MAPSSDTTSSDTTASYLDAAPAGRRRYWAIVGAFVLLTVIGLGDYFSGPELAFSLFYLVVIALTAWISGVMALSVASAVFAAVVWLTAEWMSGGPTTVGILLWNSATRLVIFAGIAALICRLKRALDLAQKLARTDYVTGVLNARAFHEAAKIEISRARRYKHPLTVAYVDVDDFKSVNDRYGHSQGDAILRTVAATLRNALRQSDSVARVGGDEFIVLLLETGYDHAEEVLTKLQQSLADAMAQVKSSVTFSMGAAVFDIPPADVDALIKAADAAMYKAKAEGKNRFRISQERPAVEPVSVWRRPAK